MESSTGSEGRGLSAAHERWHRRLYQRLGARYPRLVVLSAIPLLHVVSLGATVVAALYTPMSAGDFLALLVASNVAWLATDAVTWRLARRRLAPLERWCRGDADAATVAAAWRSGVALPRALPLNRATLGTAAVAALAWDVYATALLDLRWSAAAAFFGGSAVTYLYWALLAFLHVEHGLRPVLEDLSARHPGEEPADVARLSLRRRLALSLPAINLITGVVVAGLLPEGTGGATGLAVGIGTALAVTVTASLWLTGLLSDSIAGPMRALRDAVVRVGRGDLATRVPVAGADETADLARAFNEMVAGLQQRDRLREAFGTFVDPELAKRVAEEGVDLEGEEVDASILFLDVRGFTAYAERSEAREVVALLNRLFDCVVPAILERDGHANKFVGDGLLAVFGAPRRRADHAERAVAAAAAIVERVRATFGDGLGVGIGIHSGDVVVGTVGGGGRLDFTVIGDTVNTAARVEAATRETGDVLLITDATLDRLPSRDGWRERDATLKGKRRPVRLFARDPRGSHPAADDRVRAAPSGERAVSAR
jgi:adenylate cyclase